MLIPGLNDGHPDEGLLPGHTAQAIEDYLLRGWAPGSCIMAIFAGDLYRAVTNADTVNRNMIYKITTWVMHHAPEGSWGSYEIVADWISDKENRRSDYKEKIERKHIWQVMSEKEL